LKAQKKADDLKIQSSKIRINNVKKKLFTSFLPDFLNDEASIFGQNDVVRQEDGPAARDPFQTGCVHPERWNEEFFSSFFFLFFCDPPTLSSRFENEITVPNIVSTEFTAWKDLNYLLKEISKTKNTPIEKQ
jgi:hypothetical protein